MENSDRAPLEAAPLVIRAARRGDEHRLFELIVELGRFERLEHQITGAPGDLARELFSSPASAEALVATRSGTIIGYAIFFTNFSSFLSRSGIWLEDIFVTESERGRGVGKRLLGEVASIARQRRAARLEWAVLEWNAPAIRFYESVGASVLPDWRVCRITGLELEQLATDDRSR